MSSKQCAVYVMMIAIGVITPRFAFAWGIGKETRLTKDGKTLCVFELVHDDTPYAVLAVEGGECSGSAAFDAGKSNGSLSWSAGDEPFEVPWSCDTADGATGTVTIGEDGEEKLDLAKGKFFYVVLDGEEVHVKQCAVDMSKYKGESVKDCLLALAKTAREISSFADEWRESAKAELSDAADSR